MDGHPTNGAAMFASADFLDAEDTRPPSAFLEVLGGTGNAIQGIVQQIQSRHMSEVHPDQRSYAFQHGSNWRKRLREMMIRQNETLLSFLHKPVADHSILGSVETTLRRYAIRHDVDPEAIVTVHSVLSDLSGAELVQTEVAAEVAAHDGARAGERAGIALLADHPEFSLDYLVITNPQLGEAVPGDGRVLIAVRLGSTRLIDNIACRVGGSS